MRYFLLFFSILFVFSCKQQTKVDKTPSADEILALAQEIHKRVITIDTHNDFSVNNFTDSINYTQDLDTQVTLPKMKKGGLDVSWLIVYTGQDSLNTKGYEDAYANAMSKFNAIHKLCDSIAPNDIELALTSDDVRRISAAGKKVAMIGVENAYPIGLDMSNFKKFADLGARYMSLSHNGHSQFCDSNTGEKDSIWLYNGLSELGKKGIEEMNKWGIMIDVSHPSSGSLKQMVALSKAPIIASHSSSRKMNDHSRNITDEDLLLLKKNGGVVQTVAFKSYINTEKNNIRNDYMKTFYAKVADSLGHKWYTWDEMRKLTVEERSAFRIISNGIKKIANEQVANIPDAPGAVNVADFVDHIDYMVKLIGLEHVGISSDFDGGGGIEGWSDAAETFNVTLELVKRGYTEKEIALLWGGNLLRVLDEVQRVAKELQHQN